MPQDPLERLFHAGVKGMKWGVRKDAVRSGDGWSISADGAVSIEKGATIQRVARGHSGIMGGPGADFGLGNAMYASFTPEDNTDYEYTFGRAKGLLVKDASRILKFEAKGPLRSPPPREAAQTYLEMLRDNPQQLEAARSGLSFLARRQLDKGIKDPTTKQAHDIYSIAYDAGNYSSKMRGVNDKFIEKLSEKGYNMILDSSDALSEFNAPIIVFNARQNVQLRSARVVDRASTIRIHQEYSESYATRGRTIMQNIGMIP